MSALTADQVSHVLSGLYDRAQQTKHYLSSYKDAETPDDTDTCCAAHLARFDQRRSERRSLETRLDEIKELISLFESDDQTGVTAPAGAAALGQITLVYRDEQGASHEQPLSDLPEVGLLINPETGEDLALDHVLVATIVQEESADGSARSEAPLVGEIAEALRDRGDAKSTRAADWVLEHSEDLEVWLHIGEMLDRLAEAADRSAG